MTPKFFERREKMFGRFLRIVRFGGFCALLAAAFVWGESFGLFGDTPAEPDEIADVIVPETEEENSEDLESSGTAPRRFFPGHLRDSLQGEELEPDDGPVKAEIGGDSLLTPDEGDSADVTGFPMITPNAQSAERSLTAAETVWGRFAPGSWIRTRTVGTTVDCGKKFTSMTETRLTLVEIQSDGYLLKREVTVKMGVRNHTKEPEYIKYNFYGILFDEKMTETVDSPANLQISRKVIPCQVRRFERTTPQWREETILWYSPVLLPFVFQKETRTYSPAAAENPAEKMIRFSKTNIQRTSINFRLGNDIQSYRSQTVEQKADSVSLTKTFHSTRVPGGMLRESTVETDTDGNVLFQSATVLVDYYIHSF